MIKLKFQWFFEPPDDDGGGSSAIDLLGETPSASSSEPEPEPPTTPGFDPKALAAAFTESLTTAGFKPQPAQPAQEKPLTPEEAKKLLNVMEIDDEFLAKFDNLETRKTQLEKYRDGLIRQADTVAQLRLQEFQREMESRFAPIQQFVTQQEAERREARFNKEFPDLAKPELRPLLTAVVQGLVAQGALDAKDEAKTFKAIADATEAVIRQSNPNFKLTRGGSTPTGKTKNGNALPATTSGAGGGGGSKPADTSGRPKAMQYL